MAAMAARRSQTFIGAKHRARLARMDTPVAIKATARELACLIYLMVTEGQEYVDQGIGAYEKRRLNRKFAHLDRQARKTRAPTRPENARRGKTEPNAINRLGICYSRERALLTPRNPARSMDYRADRRRTRAPINSLRAVAVVAETVICGLPGVADQGGLRLGLKGQERGEGQEQRGRRASPRTRKGAGASAGPGDRSGGPVSPGAAHRREAQAPEDAGQAKRVRRAVRAGASRCRR